MQRQKILDSDHCRNPLKKFCTERFFFVIDVTDQDDRALTNVTTWYSLEFYDSISYDRTEGSLIVVIDWIFRIRHNPDSFCQSIDDDTFVIVIERIPMISNRLPFRES